MPAAWLRSSPTPHAHAVSCAAYASSTPYPRHCVPWQMASTRSSPGQYLARVYKSPSTVLHSCVCGLHFCNPQYRWGAVCAEGLKGHKRSKRHKGRRGHHKSVILSGAKDLKVSEMVDRRTAREILEFLYPAPLWQNKRACSAHSLIAAFTPFRMTVAADGSSEGLR